MAEVILKWHNVTSIFELRIPQHNPHTNDHKTTNVHLSRYCAYLVRSILELLPDEYRWCKSMYNVVTEDSMNCFIGTTINGGAMCMPKGTIKET